MTLRAFPIITLMATLLAGATPAGQTTHEHRTNETDEAVAEFDGLVDEYVQLHHALLDRLGPDVIPPTPEEIERRSERLARDLRDARTGAVVGEIFTPRIAAVLRQRIAAALHEHRHGGAMMAERHQPPSRVALEPNERFPWEVSRPVWPALRQRLPAIPEELDYQFAGNALVLLDVRANVVVDVLADALVAERPHHSAEPPLTPCDVHPEMPMCWS
jgi:hypothetical protein